MPKVEIAKPKEFYKEVRELIAAHYKSLPRSGSGYIRNSFAKRYPIVYGIYLEIAALGLNR